MKPAISPEQVDATVQGPGRVEALIRYAYWLTGDMKLARRYVRQLWPDGKPAGAMWRCARALRRLTGESSEPPSDAGRKHHDMRAVLRRCHPERAELLALQEVLGLTPAEIGSLLRRREADIRWSLAETRQLLLELMAQPGVERARREART